MSAFGDFMFTMLLARDARLSARWWGMALSPGLSLLKRWVPA